MSKIGKKLIVIPDNVKIEVLENEVMIKGPKGELKVPLFPDFNVELEGNYLKIIPTREKKFTSAFWGTLRSLIANAVKGVSEGFEKKLEIEGVGYRANVEGNILVLNLGFSHPIRFEIPKGIDIVVAKNLITISGADKQLVGQTAAKIRSFRKPEPYKGKGIHYVGEHIRRKAGKKATATA
ncbi:MAG: 50S ribosomal protein L6 [Candidatus Paceibacterota bacterium]|jgi:large subunit ribosomal protein L6|nr:50S ribosomal protein L6 [Candidatus Paceibacterota bacterium]HPD55295.1 50S ribosomal protein L6 [Candidatus Paceibacterota bacterium]HQM34725.1 50S ribosomal protein L6 [Candidatus Paceibacterota bacterium]